MQTHAILLEQITHNNKGLINRQLGIDFGFTKYNNFNTLIRKIVLVEYR